MAGLTIKVIDEDDDYLGIEIQVSNARFAGSTRIYAGNDELSEFAATIAGFPTSASDERIYEFGSRDPSSAGGYCKLHFRCVDSAAHAIVEVSIDDDKVFYSDEEAHLSFGAQPAAIDQFTKALHGLERARSGEVTLPSIIGAENPSQQFSN